jgi:hypothetical protein
MGKHPLRFWKRDSVSSALLQAGSGRVGGLIAALAINMFLLPTLYVWIAEEGDVLPNPETEFENG